MTPGPGAPGGRPPAALVPSRSVSRVRARVLSWRGLAMLAAIALVVAVGASRGAERLGPASSDDDRFSQVCRDHGGTPSLAPGSGDYVKDSRSCVVRYGAHTYEMYAVTPAGFDRREAGRARQACASQARNDRLLGDRPGVPDRRVWHPRTAICEAQP
ncbi:MAG: hypothetical protein QOD81_4422 [Solirubrobacteraceae bacterium]|nr:hypothetical protein [Solirubrobacteraceae bacterium]